MNKRIFSIAILLLVGVSFFYGEAKAKDVVLEASRQSSVTESISYIQKQLKEINDPSQKRSLTVFLAGLQEQLSLYEEAQKNYAAAAGIGAADAEGMIKKSNEQLVIDAVRCALCSGDYATADSYLNSAVRNSRNQEIISYVKLYAQWSALCRAETKEDLQEPLEILKAYIKVDSMKVVQPAILLTLWYVTGEEEYSSRITKDFAKSTEAAIVSGDIQLLPTPFWFFVPKSGIAEQGTGTFTEVSVTAAPEAEKKTETLENSEQKVTKYSKWQLGLFKTEANAKLLADEVKKKGFDANIKPETRASGTTYYIVYVNEDKSGNVADKLRSAGYECYPVE